MQFGNISIEILETGTFALDGGAMFGVVPKNLWERAYHAADAQNRIPMKAQCLLVRGDIGGKHRVILVDTGNGDKMPAKLRDIYKMDSSEHELSRSLQRFGVTAADVTDVVLTHLHFDHAGGATMLNAAQELVPTFPNARYYVQKEQWQWAQNPSDKDRASFVKQDYEPLLAHGVIELLDGAGQLFEGIDVLPLFGHTTAMQAVKISTEAGVVFFGADVFPTSAHVALPYIMGYDNFPLTTLEEKKILTARAADEAWIVVFEHDGFRQASNIVRTDKGFARGEAMTITSW
ncbi:MAG: MBL fold metallo-hydrolase [Candidatus Kapaibacterium sp.]|nr:MAG: MBL fold metallo-hydrolase [Candidatus Kapabacteria bacterium]